MSIGNAHVIECAGPPLAAPPFVGMHWVDTAANCHYLSVGTSVVGDWIKTEAGESVTEKTATNSTTTSLVVIPLANFCAIKFHLCYFNVAEDKWKSLLVHAAKVTSTTVEHSIYSGLGSTIDVVTNFIISGTDAVLEATNNETYDLTARFRTEII